MNLSNSLNAHFPLLKQAVNAPFSRLIIFLLLCLVGFNLPIANAIPTIGNWVFPDRDYRMPISVAANGYARTDKIAELDVDFGVRLTALGAVGTFDEDSIRVVEVDVSGSSLDTDVPFQFDNGSSIDEPAGTLVFVMVGSTAVSATRYYHIYFDTTGAFSAPTPPADRV
ncbi:MAG: hypothetical protein GY943_08115, partial [Chloroflexi bacterium]|nr:hypothetical protein [Chloroflexota bacterium]